MLVTVIALLRTEILADWEKTLPVNAPNVFAINLADDEKQSYLDALDRQSWVRSAGYPIFRGRLVANNDELFAESAFVKDEALRRELSLTWQNRLPDKNQLSAGEWATNNSVSVEEKVAQRLGIQLGDTLTFSIYGQDVTAQVTNFRTVEWRNMQPNFYFVFSRDVLRDFSATWLVSFRVDDGDQPFLTVLAKAYPTVSLMDVRQLSTNVKMVLDKLAVALSILAWVAVLSGLLLMITLLKLNLRKRCDELHLYRILGASRQQLRQTLWFEYGAIALLAGSMASLGAFGILSLILTVGFGLPIVFIWEIVLLPFMALILVLLVVQRTVVRLSQV
jgi:putative ABC transport system permease protein